MKDYIDSNDIKRHQKILSESHQEQSLEYDNKCENLYRLSESKKSFDVDLVFFKECAKSSQNANLWLDSCIDILESRKDPRLQSVFENDVLPMIGLQYLSKAANNMNYTEDIRNMIRTHYNLTLAAEQVLNFDEAVNKFDSNFKQVLSESDFHNSIIRCCNDIDEITGPEYPISNKIIASVNEALFNMKQDKSYKYELSIVKEVMNYFACMYADKYTARDCDLAIRGLTKDPLLYNYYCEAFDTRNLENDLKKSSSSIANTCNIYNDETPIDNVSKLVAIKNKVLNASVYDIMNNFNSFLLLIEKIVISTREKQFETDFAINLISGLYQDIYDTIIIRQPKARSIVSSLIHSIDESIARIDNYLKVTDNVMYDTYHLVILKNTLVTLKTQLNDSLDFIYTDYANECALMNTFTEADENMTLNEFKLFKFDNLVSKCYKLDMYLKNKFNQFKDKFTNSIKNASKKIFDEATEYDMINEDGNLDYCITSFDITEIKDFSPYHEFCTDILREINQESIYGEVVYYQVNPDTLEFRMRKDFNIQLTQEEVNTLELNMSYEDMNRVRLITLCSELYRENYNYIEESIEFFKRNNNSEYFETYLEACSLAGVPKETILEIYDTLKDYHGSKFAVENSYNVSNYESYITEAEIAMEAANIIEVMLEADKPMNNRQQSAQQRINNKLNQTNNKNSVKTNIVNTTKKVGNTIQNVKNKVEENKPTIGDKVKKVMTNLKLYAQGLKSAFKKADAKSKTAIQNMNAGFDRFAKSLKSAFISDRRESIIKGSVIPSFHKCIMLAVGFAGLAWFNLPIAVITAIGGFAASKELTKKERALLYDDIMIELKILEKEIQRAEDKHQIKKLRELMRMKKELERQAARIQYNIRVGKDIIPGGRYINQDND